MEKLWLLAEPSMDGTKALNRWLVGSIRITKLTLTSVSIVLICWARLNAVKLVSGRLGKEIIFKPWTRLTVKVDSAWLMASFSFNSLRVIPSKS